MTKSHRKEGALKPLSGNTMPKHFIFFDTETYTIIDEDNGVSFPFRLGVAIYIKRDYEGIIVKREVLRFTKLDAFYKFILRKTSKREKLYIMAHNIGFDLRVCNIIHHFKDIGFSSEPPIINQMVFIWSLAREKEKIEFLDTSNLGVRSVSSLGKDMGYQKLTIDFDNSTDEELMTYCLRDTEILEKFVLGYLDFIETNRLGSFKTTLASQALTSYRTSFMNAPIYLHNHYGATLLERDAYYGGRTEAFKIGYLGESEYFYLDVNSMYPHAMINFQLPSRIVDYREDIHYKDFVKIIKNYYVIADVTLETSINAFPLRLSNEPKDYNHIRNKKKLPYPDNSSKRLIFPIGKFRTTLHHEELLEAMRTSKILKIHRLTAYTKENPFNDYIAFFYEAKNKYGKEGNKTWRMIAKLFLNALYGKFGQLLPHREHIGETVLYDYYRLPMYDLDNDIHYQEIIWESKVYKEYKKGETAFSNPAIAGAITANARMTLYHMIEIAGKENVFYTDTDSLIVNKKGYDKLSIIIDSEKIGYLDLEQKGRRLIIRGNKDYRLDATKRFKGLPATAKKVGANAWQYLHFQGFITWLNNEAKEDMVGSINYKSRRSIYRKGIVSPDGNVIPFYLDED